MLKPKQRLLAASLMLVALAAAVVLFLKLRGASQPDWPQPVFVGSGACASCHKVESEKWRDSDHALAMQEASSETVLGDFNNAGFDYFGVTTTFYKRDGKFFVKTDGPDGELHEYPVAYTFGARPLQQYLVAFPDGKLQSLSIAWDSRPRAEGGGRWFHLYPDEKITSESSLHWTRREQNWNYQCAECHSTNLQKNYDLSRDSYSTTWSEINVACEACHGPGSNHLAWAEGRKSDDPSKGLLISFLKPESGEWRIDDPATGIAVWNGPPRSRAELNSCARCHSRRRPITDTYTFNRPLMDTHAPAPLESELYFADGQIQGEVYEYGSFTQSKMYRAGVTCSDCHEAHSLGTRAAGNALCSKCHEPSKFNSISHHHHPPDSAGAECAGCHMPERIYMVVDRRRDHSFRIPRPDLSVKYGTPNACVECHKEKSDQWAADAVAKWRGRDAKPQPHFVEALDTGRRGALDAEKLLAALATDRQQPPAARASALIMLTDYLSPSSISACEAGLADEDPMVRAAALHSIEPLPSGDRLRLAGRLLRDPVRAVRIEAARSLADVTPGEMQADFDRALKELIESEMANAERPESHLNLGLLYGRLGRIREAEDALKTSLRLDSKFIPAMINLADLYREQSREGEGEQLLRRAIKIDSGSAEALYALGLLRIRQGRKQEGLDLLSRAARVRPQDVRYTYVYAVALNSAGDAAGAVAALEQAYNLRPSDREVLTALATINRDRGDVQSALRYAERLAALLPDDRDVRRLLEELRRVGQ